MASTRPDTISRRCEFAAAAILLILVAIVAARLLNQGLLPAPFYDWPNASLMDLHSTAWWAHHHGAYESWRAIYPPFSFVLLDLATLRRCYIASPEAGRACDWLSQAALLGTFVANLWLLWLSYRRVEPASAPARAFIVGAGLPMLYALERGNLLIPCFTAFLLGAGPLLARPIARWAALAVAVNLKPYLLVVIAPAAARRDLRWLVGFGAVGLVLYLASWLAFGEGSPAQLALDLLDYAPGKSAALEGNLHYATSLWPLARALRSGALSGVGVNPKAAEALAGGCIALMRMAQIGTAACLIAAVAKPRRINDGRLLALCGAVILTTVTNGSAGYAQIFVFFLIGLEPARGGLRIALLACAFLLSLPVDMAIGPQSPTIAWSWLGQRWVEAPHGLTLGQLLRPFGLMAIQFLLIPLNLADSLGSSPAGTDAPDARGS